MLARRFLMLLFGLLGLAAGAQAGSDLIAVKRLTAEAAEAIVHNAVAACRTRGYQVTAVVVDRGGYPQAMVRDTLASRFTVEIAERKANAVILAGVSSGRFRQNRSDIRQEMNQVSGILALDGGIPIRAAGAVVGAVGVSGAPGGDKDAQCAKEGLAPIQERLDFAQ